MSFSLIKTAWAQKELPTTFPTVPLIGEKFRTFGGVLAAFLNIVFYSGVALTFIFLIIGGIRYVTSGGSKEGAEAARSMITNAVIGFIVIVGAFTLRIIVEKMLAVSGMPTEILPTF